MIPVNMRQYVDYFIRHTEGGWTNMQCIAWVESHGGRAPKTTFHRETKTLVEEGHIERRGNLWFRIPQPGDKDFPFPLPAPDPVELDITPKTGKELSTLRDRIAVTIITGLLPANREEFEAHTKAAWEYADVMLSTRSHRDMFTDL